MINITTCPTCGSKNIKKVRRNQRREVHGKKYVVPGLTFHQCPDCGEQVYSPEAVRKIQEHSPAFGKLRKRHALQVG